MQAEFLFRKHKCRVQSTFIVWVLSFFFPCDKSKSIVGERTAERPLQRKTGNCEKRLRKNRKEGVAETGEQKDRGCELKVDPLIPHISSFY